MHAPQQTDRIVCPQNGEKLAPAQVWQGAPLAGKPQRYGTFPTHHHRGETCSYGPGFSAPLVEPAAEATAPGPSTSRYGNMYGKRTP